MSDFANRFEKRARTRKVRRLCSAVRQASPATDRWGLSDWAAAADQDLRHLVATIAGIKDPSGATWRRVVRSLRYYRS